MVYLEARVAGQAIRWKLDPGSTVIVGRADDCDVIVDDASISRRHLELALRDGVIAIRDLGSTNGVWRDRERITVAELAHDEWFVVGRVPFAARRGSQLMMDTDERLAARYMGAAGGAAARGASPAATGEDWRGARDEFARQYFAELIERCGGNISEASRVAGISRSNFYRHLNDLGLREHGDEEN